MKTNIKTNVSVVLVTLITTIFLFSSCVVSEEFLNELFYEPDYTSEEVSEEEIVSSDFTTTVSGSYRSEDWGEIILTQQGNQVTGKYDYGTMRGTLTGNRLEGNWEGTFGGMGMMILDFSSDASSFSGYYASGYEDPVPSNPNSIRWTGNRIGSSLSTGQIEEIFGGWIDTNESLSGFIFKPDNSLILFFDGEIAEGYWENSANSLSLFVENATGEFIIFESFYEFDGANLHLYFDNDHLVLEKHWVATAEDIFSYYRQLGIGGNVT